MPDADEPTKKGEGGPEKPLRKYVGDPMPWRTGGSANRGHAGRGRGDSDLGAAFQFGIGAIAFTLLGYWLDGKFGTGPLLLIIGMFVGASAGFFSMYRKLTAREKSGEPEAGKGGAKGGNSP